MRVAPRVEVDYCNNFIYAIGHVAECVTGLQICIPIRADCDNMIQNMNLLCWFSLVFLPAQNFCEIHQVQFEFQILADLVIASQPIPH